MTKPAYLPPVGPPPRPALTTMEDYYLRALRHWFRHRRDPPSLAEFADLCRRSGAPTTASGMRKRNGWPSRRAVRFGLLGLEGKGYTRRNNEGKFEVIR